MHLISTQSSFPIISLLYCTQVEEDLKIVCFYMFIAVSGRKASRKGFEQKLETSMCMTFHF